MHYFDLPRIEDCIREIREKIPVPDIFDQLAEEAAELAQAANKMARIMRGTNPANIDEREAIKNVVEEYTDVNVVAKDILELQVDGLQADYKLDRWAKRLEERDNDLRDHTEGQ